MKKRCKCCKCEKCIDYSKEIEEIKRKQKLNYDQLKNEINMVSYIENHSYKTNAKLIHSIGRRLDSVSVELENKIDNERPNFFAGALLVVIITFIINFFFNVMVVV